MRQLDGLAIGLLALLLAAGCPAQEAGEFVNLGPGGGGAIYNANASPHDPNLCFVWCDMGGLYRSTDGGKAWTMLDASEMRSGHTCKVLFHPTNADIIYGVSRGVVKESKDKGLTWSVLNDGSAWKGETVVELGIDQADPKTMLLGTDKSAYLSADAGKTWKKIEGTTGRVVGFFARKSIFVATADGIWRSDDGGATWAKKDKGLPWTGLRDFCGAERLLIDDLGPLTILYCVIPSKAVDGKFAGGVYKSEDLGETWTSAMGDGLDTGLGRPEVAPRADIAEYLQVGCAQNNPDIIWCTTRGRAYLPPHHWTVYRSVTAGKSWEATFYWDSRDKHADNVEPTWLALDFAWGWGGPPLSFSVNPGNPDQAFYTNTGELWVTDDAGKTWRNGACRPKDGKAAPKVAWTTRGLEVTVPHDLVFDPFDPNVIHGGWSDIGCLRSDDRGESWTVTSQGLPWRNTFYMVVPDPQKKGRLWAGASNHHGIPAWSYIGIERKSSGGVVVSDDGGLTWKVSSEGLPNSAITSIVLDPTSPVDSRTLYAAVFREGVYKSTDGGATWKKTSDGLPDDNLDVYMLKRTADGTLYVSITGKRDGTNFLALSGIYKSTDASAKWTCITKPLQLRWINGFDVDERDTNVVYLTCSAIPRGHDGGIHKTVDGGATWQDITPKYDKAWQGFMHAYAALIDPDDSKTVYFSTGTHGLFISRDAGETWKPVKGIPFNNVLKTVLDPRDKGVIWALTYGGGIWKGKPVE